LVVLPGDPTHVVDETPLADLRTWMQYLVSLGVFVVVLRIPRLLNNHAGHAVTPLALALWVARAFATGGAGGGAAASPAMPAAPTVMPVAASPAGLAPPPAGGTTASAASGGA